RILAPLTAPIGALVHDVKELFNPKEAVFKEPPFSPRCIATLHLGVRFVKLAAYHKPPPTIQYPATNCSMLVIAQCLIRMMSYMP
ncbi:MAG: hypothetical protein ACOYVG_13850, partial [Bacteroidota bacterium]